MFTSDEIEIEEVDPSSPVVLLVVTTPLGEMRLVADIRVVNHVLYADGVHVGGLSPGPLGRAGLNTIGRKMLEIAGVDQIVIQGRARTTGANKGRIPQPIRFPKR